MGKSQAFRFDGGAASYLGVGLVSWLLTLATIGLAAPWAIVMRHRWRAKHTSINGVRLEFTGSGIGLWGNWIKWWALTFVTVGFYGLWVGPRLQQWVVEHTDFAPHGAVPMPPAPVIVA